MIIYMKQNATPDAVETIVNQVELANGRAFVEDGDGQKIIGVIGKVQADLEDKVLLSAAVERTAHTKAPYKLAGREYRPKNTTFSIGDHLIGGDEVVVMAGPCAIESRAQIIEIAHAVKAAGATMLRGGAYKPRSSPYSFQGLGVEGLEYMAEAREQTGLPIISEVMEPELVPVVAEYVDVLQLGARNMQNYALLHAVGKSQHPVMLKRGLSSTIEEWLCAAEYIMSHGNNRVMLCERGIRSYDQSTRNAFDLNAIPVLRQLTHLPIIADPSHATGYREYVPAMSKAAIAAGADGLIIEVHPNPDKAVSDGRGSMELGAFGRLVPQLHRVAEAVDRSVAVSAELMPA